MTTSELVFWFFLRHHIGLVCPHGQWAPKLWEGTETSPVDGAFCIYCDTGQST